MIEDKLSWNYKNIVENNFIGKEIMNEIIEKNGFMNFVLHRFYMIIRKL